MAELGDTMTAAELRAQTRLLRDLLTERKDAIHEIGVLEAPPAQAVLEDWPVAGAKRSLVRRTGNGGLLTVDTNGEPVVGFNEARLGGLIVNTGSVGVTLYLGPQAGAAVPQTWVSGNGGTWDFKLGPLFWCGSVFAVADSASTTLSLAEL